MEKNPSDAAGGGNLMTEQVKQQTQRAAQQAQDAVGQVADQARSQAVTTMDTQKDRAAHSLSTVAEAFRQTGHNLEQQDQRAVSQIANSVANRIDRLAGYLQGRDINQLAADVEEYTRRNPALVLGGAFALGVLAARFFKSSASGSGSGRQEFSSSAYGAGYGYTPYPSYRPGMSQGASAYGDNPYRYEDVQGAPYVRQRYAQGPTAMDTGYASTGTDVGTEATAATPETSRPVTGIGATQAEVTADKPDAGTRDGA